MDILEYLEDEHEDLRRRMVAIRRGLAQRDLGEKIGALIASYRLHEAVEEDLLFPPARRALRNAPGLLALIPDFELSHRNLLRQLRRVQELLQYSGLGPVQQAFFDFSAGAEAHIGQEERVLFPVLREALDGRTREELGADAEERAGCAATRGAAAGVRIA